MRGPFLSTWSQSCCKCKARGGLNASEQRFWISSLIAHLRLAATKKLRSLFPSISRGRFPFAVRHQPAKYTWKFWWFRWCGQTWSWPRSEWYGSCIVTSPWRKQSLSHPRLLATQLKQVGRRNSSWMWWLKLKGLHSFLSSWGWLLLQWLWLGSCLKPGKFWTGSLWWPRRFLPQAFQFNHLWKDSGT